MSDKVISVVWPFSRGYWDMSIIEALFSNRWRPSCAYEFQHFFKFVDVPEDVDGVIVVLPARHCLNYYDALNVELSLARDKPFKWVLLIAIGDEESLFDTSRVKHPNMKVWRQLPKPGLHDSADRFIINGWATDTIEMLPRYEKEVLSKPIDWCFMGQITHKRREQCVSALMRMTNGDLLKTDGFTKGYPHEEYFRHLANAKVAPCPSGAEMPDSFRVAEALEAGCIPVADGVSPKDNYPRGYWKYVFGEDPPFPVIEDWSILPAIVSALVARWPENSNRIQSWWSHYKRQLAYNLRDDINALRKVEPVAETIDDKITVLVPTSPIPSHPDTFKIDQVIAGIRYHLPTAEIIIMCDGARPSTQHRKVQYTIYKEHLLWKAKFDPAYKNIHIEVFEQEGENHPCQSGMVRSVLERGLVKTPLIFFAEHDAPLLPRPIDWNMIADVLLSDEARIVRFYYFEQLIPEHNYLFHGSIRKGEVELVRTTQYSGWPHVTTTANMLNLVKAYAPFRGRDTVLETCLYSPISSAPWEQFKVVIYADGPNIGRFIHTNGRGEAEERDSVDW